jgi:hypothetical protein
MPIKTAIYDPPIKGLPYLIVTLEADGVKVSSGLVGLHAAQHPVGDDGDTSKVCRRCLGAVRAG